MARKAATAELIPAEPRELVDIGLDLEADAGAGSEFVTSTDMVVPYLQIIQKGSPQVDQSDGRYVKDARVRDILNTITGEVFDGQEGIRVLPVSFKRKVIVWRPRESGGGLVAVYEPEEGSIERCVKDDKGKDRVPEGNIAQTTAHHWVLQLRDDGTTVGTVISKTSTQLKKSRRWVTQITGIRVPGKNWPFNPPSFSHVYRLSTVSEENPKGKWHEWKIELEGAITSSEIYADARGLHALISGGKLDVTLASPDDEPSMPTGDGVI